LKTSKESSSSPELQTTIPADSVSFLSCPVKLNAEDEDTLVSSNSSPFSSPDALANYCVKCHQICISNRQG
ncbi:unnamed protein product, partial [Staurois parvus]